MVRRLFLLSLVVVFELLAQSLPGSIDGRVTNSQTGVGVAGATVRLLSIQMRTSGSPKDPTVTTAEDGSFRFETVAAGTYFAVVESKGFVRSISGTNRPMSVLAGQQLSGVSISLVPQGAISGRIVDEEGNGQAGARVEAFTKYWTQGQWRLQRVSQTTTDESGGYRLPNTSPGNYYLAAEPSNEAASVNRKAPQAQPMAATREPTAELVRTYYPRSSDLNDAGTIDVQSGQDASGANIEMRRVLTHHIKGRVDAFSETATHRYTLILTPKTEMELTSLEREEKVGSDGRFDFSAVISGEYVLRLIDTNSSLGHMSRRYLLAQQDIEVGANDVIDLDLTPSSPETVTGHVSLDGVDNPDFSQMRITLTPTADYLLLEVM